MTRQEGGPRQAETITDNELQAVAYFAVGVSSEGSVRGRNVAYELAFAGYIHEQGDRSRRPPIEAGTFQNNQLEPIYDSGYSLGTLQTDFGQQRNDQNRNADRFLDAYQDWARQQTNQRSNPPLTQAEYHQASQALSRHGNEIRGDVGTTSDNSYDIPPGIKTRLNAFLATDEGITYVHNQDVAQANHLMRADGPLRQLEATTLYQNATQGDQIRMATVMAKLENQDGSRHWPGIIRRINSGVIDSLDEIKAAVPQHLHGDRDNALRGAELLIELRSAGERNPLRTAWQDVVANPLVNPTRLDQDRTHPDLEAEYSTVKNLFMVSAQAKPFVHALNDGGQRALDIHFAGASREQTAGLYAAGNDFVQWNRDGHGHANVGGQWSTIERNQVTRVERGLGAVDLTVSRDGVSTPLLHVDPRAPAHRADEHRDAPAPHRAAQQNHDGERTGHGVRPGQGERHGSALPSTSLHGQAEAGVRQLDAALGKSYDSASERMTASLAVLAKQNGLERIDRILLSTQSDHTRAGENVFIVQGDPSDPAKRMAYMKTQDAVGIPVERSLAQFHELDQRQSTQVLAASNEPTVEIAGPRLRV